MYGSATASATKTGVVSTQRLAALALTGREIGARAALEWGLVDEIGPNVP